MTEVSAESPYKSKTVPQLELKLLIHPKQERVQDLDISRRVRAIGRRKHDQPAAVEGSAAEKAGGAAEKRAIGRSKCHGLEMDQLEVDVRAHHWSPWGRNGGTGMPKLLKWSLC